MTVLETDISDLTHDGRGVAHVAGKAMFVAGALAGERVRLSFTRKHRHYDEAIVEEILQASPDRVVPRCAHFGVCGGCALQHLDPAAQIAAKRRVLMENLERIGKVEPQEFLPALTDQPWGYRRKARLSVKFVEKKGRVLVGFRETNGRFVADIRRCDVLASRRSASASTRSQRWSNRWTRIATFRRSKWRPATTFVALVFRHLQPLSERDLASLTSFAKSSGLGIFLQSGGMDSVTPLWPEQMQLSYRLADDLDIEFQPLDFVQVNAGMNRRMIELTLGLLSPQPSDRVLDLFCGLGNFTLPLAKRAMEVTGVEGEAGLVRRAQQNAIRNNIHNAHFLPADLAADQRAAPWAKGRLRPAAPRPAAQRRGRGSGLSAETFDAARRVRIVSPRLAGARCRHARASPRFRPEKRRRHGYVPAHGARGIHCAVRSRMIATAI